MAERSERELRARELFLRGYNCSQAVFAAFAPDMGMDEGLALRVASAFGGGVAGTRQTCGTVNGMLMALGALRGGVEAPDAAAKKALYDQAKALMERFDRLYGTTCCLELLQKNGVTPKPDPAERDAEYYLKRPCLRYVEAAVRLLEGDVRGVIFDLDGVIVSTDDCHYRAWKRMADEEGIPFDRARNDRLRGVSRMASLEIVLEQAKKTYTDAEKLEMATRKNAYYVELIGSLTPGDILPGALDALALLRARGVRLAIGSSSRNAPLILKQIGLENAFDAVADGNQITHSKPDPEVFVLAARLLDLPPESCLVVEDAEAGVDAALAGGMKALGVGAACAYERATYRAQSLLDANFDAIISEGYDA